MSSEPKRGRPALTPGEPPARLHVKVSATEYATAQEVAARYGVSVAEVVRRGLRLLTKDGGIKYAP